MPHGSGPRGDASLSLQTPKCAKMLAISRPDAKATLLRTLRAAQWTHATAGVVLRSRESRIIGTVPEVKKIGAKGCITRQTYKKHYWNAAVSVRTLDRNAHPHRNSSAGSRATGRRRATDQIATHYCAWPLLPGRRPRPRKDAALRQQVRVRVESNFRRPTPSSRCCVRSCVCSMAWSFHTIDAALSS